MNFYTHIPGEPVSDRELVLLYKQSLELQHLSTLYTRYMDLVFGVCMKYFKDPERSKDAVMDIFEELVAKLKKHEVENFKGWLHVLSRNYCLMELRAKKNIRTTEFRAEFMQSGDDIHLDAGIIEKEENFQKLEKCLAALPVEQRQAVQLFYLEKKCYKEIAGMTGLDWNMVRSYIQNGRRNLKNCMEKRMGLNEKPKTELKNINRSM